MMSLGTLLVRHGWITKQQLGLAISKQREIGARLGTCLLEMGAIAEELLNRALAEQQGVPSVANDDLASIPEKVVRLLPAPIAIRYRAIPFRATHTDVDIAMLEVDNLWLQDELSFIVGRRLNVYIANEARVVEALARYYKAPCSERFAKLLMRLNHERQLKVDERRHPTSRLVEFRDPTQAPATADPTMPPPAPSATVTSSSLPSPTPIRRPSSIPVTVQELASLETSSARSEALAQERAPADLYSRDASSKQSPGLGQIEQALEASSDPEEVGRLLLTALSLLFTRIMLLKVTPAQVRGWLAQGPGLDRQRLEHFAVTFDQPSIFLNLREGGSFYLGSLPGMPAHVELMACWRKDLTDECVVFPIRVRDRLVALVYGDSGPLGLSDLDLDRVRELCGIAARAFERCILDRKRRSQLSIQRG